MKTRKLYFIISIICCLLGCQKKSEIQFDIPGVIFTKEQTAAAEYFQKGKDSWTPTNKQIEELENLFPEYISNYNVASAKEIYKNLSTYKRQYLGFTENGEQLIFINAFCEHKWKDNDKWKSQFVFVFDGGDCYFQAIYNPSKHKFEKLFVNGVA
jgi:hypothetical protein